MSGEIIILLSDINSDTKVLRSDAFLGTTFRTNALGTIISSMICIVCYIFMLIYLPPFSDPENQTSAVNAGFIVVNGFAGASFLALLIYLLVLLDAPYGGSKWRFAVELTGMFEGLFGVQIILGGVTLGLAINESALCSADGYSCRNTYYWYLFTFFLALSAYATHMVLSHLNVE